MKINLLIKTHLLFQICAWSENKDISCDVKKPKSKQQWTQDNAHPEISFSMWRIFSSIPNIKDTNNLGFRNTIKIRCDKISFDQCFWVSEKKIKLLRLSSHILFSGPDCYFLEAVSGLQDLMPSSYLPQRWNRAETGNSLKGTSWAGEWANLRLGWL